MSDSIIHGYKMPTFIDHLLAAAAGAITALDPVDQREALIRLSYEVLVRLGADSAVDSVLLAAFGSYLDGGDAQESIEALEAWLGAERADTDWAQERVRRLRGDQ